MPTVVLMFNASDVVNVERIECNFVRQQTIFTLELSSFDDFEFSFCRYRGFSHCDNKFSARALAKLTMRLMMI